jgi:hypothetical protein
VQLAKAITLSNVKASQIVKGLAEKANILVMGIAVFNVGKDLYETGSVTPGHAADLVMARIAFIPGWGWIASGGYFAFKTIFEHGKLTPEQQVERRKFLDKVRERDPYVGTIGIGDKFNP